MRNILLFSLLLLFSALTCNREDDFREEVQLAYNETETFSSEALSIRWTEINDSRCPLNVTCVWAGEARVTLRVVKNGVEESLELKTQGLCQDETGPCGEEKELFGYRFRLLFVYPYPREATPIEREDYLVKLVVEKI